MVVRAERAARWCASRDVADVVLGAEDYDTAVQLQRPDRGLHRRLVPAQRQLARRHQARARRDGARCRRSCPSRSRRRIAYDATEYIQNAIDEVVQHAARDAAHRRDRHLPLPRLAALGAGAGGGHSRSRSSARIFLMQAFGFTHQPAHAARHRALGRAGGRRRHRGGGERRAPPARRAKRRSTPRSRARASWSGPSSP